MAWSLSVAGGHCSPIKASQCTPCARSIAAGGYRGFACVVGYPESSNATWAYFSPLTRAWELALGTLIAVIGPAVSRVPTRWVYQVAALLGLAGIVVSALILTSSMPYPGWAVAIPVVGTALLIGRDAVIRRQSSATLYPFARCNG